MNLLKMSLSGGIMVLAVIILRSILLNRFPKRVFVLFWTIVLMRLLIPFQISSVFSIFSFVNKYFVGEDKTVYTAGKFIPVQTAEMVFENTYNHSSRNFFTISPIMILWFIGMTVTFIVFACIYRNCQWNIKTSLPVKNDYIIHWIETHRLRRTLNIRVSENIKSPLTFGIFKPVILIPKSIEYADKNHLKFILLHEYIHVCRWDAAVKLLLAAALCIHWFNPLVWIMYRVFNRDIELACDERVVLYSGENVKKEYAHMLIDMSEKINQFSSLQNNFNTNSIEERIKAIMKINKITYKSVILFSAVAAALVAVFATSASIKSENAVVTQKETALADSDSVDTAISRDELPADVVIKKEEVPTDVVNEIKNMGFEEDMARNIGWSIVRSGISMDKVTDIKIEDNGNLKVWVKDMEKALTAPRPGGPLADGEDVFEEDVFEDVVIEIENMGFEEDVAQNIGWSLVITDISIDKVTDIKIGDNGNLKVWVKDMEDALTAPAPGAPLADGNENSLIQSHEMGVASGKITDQTQFFDSYKLHADNGKYVYFCINNTGNVPITATINDRNEHTFNPGDTDYIYKEIKNGILGRGKSYTFKAVPGKNGGNISMDWKIAQSD